MTLVAALDMALVATFEAIFEATLDKVYGCKTALATSYIYPYGEDL